MNAMPAIAPQAGPLRLTRRGRLVVAVAVALLIAVVMLVATGTARATSSPPSQGKANTQNLAQVVVAPGESLWSVAERADPGQDTRNVIQQVIDLNALTGDVVYAGQRLWLPRG